MVFRFSGRVAKSVLEIFAPSARLVYCGRIGIRRRSLVTMPKQVTIGTHSGCFHCDEALACFMLRLLPRYKDATIVRSRDKEVLDTCDIVVDVGGEYDHSKLRYDHHMREFKESVSTVINKPGYDWTIKLSSAGLIYCHYGQEIIKHLIPEVTDETDLCNIWKKIYDTLIKEVDAIDNGVPMFEGEPLYRINTNLSSRVSRLNPHWNSQNLDVDEQFRKAMALTGEEFIDSVEYTAKVWWPARSIVQEALNKRYEIDPSGEIVAFDRCVPWKEHLFELEKELGVEPTIKFAVFDGDGSFRVQGVPVSSGSYTCRIFLPQEWGGLRNEELSRVSGIDGCTFVHTVRFIGGHKTKDGAVSMARKALEMGKSEQR